MLDARALELINADIDGELEQQERAELDAILAASAEARAIRAEMRKLANLLEGTPEQQPPEDLAKRILEQLPSRSFRPSFSIAGLLSSFQPLPLGLAFAAGLLVTVGFYETSSGPRTGDNVADMVGTMVVDPQGGVAGQVDRLPITGPGLVGSVAASDVGEILVLAFDLVSNQKTEVVIGMADAGLDFGGMARGPSSEPADGDYFEVRGGSLFVVNGANRPFNVYLRRVDGGRGYPKGVGIEVIQSGERVFEGSLALHGDNS